MKGLNPDKPVFVLTPHFSKTAYYLRCYRRNSALGLCSLLTFEQAFGQLQQIRKRNGLKNTF